MPPLRARSRRSRRLVASVVAALLTPATLATLVTGGLVACADAPTRGDGAVLLVVPAGDALGDRMHDEARDYLARLSGFAVASWRPTAPVSRTRLQQEAEARAAALVVALDHASPCEGEGDRYGLEHWDAGAFDNHGGSRGATFVATHGATRLARQYALYEVLRRLGARFFHPEQEFVPRNALADLRPRARTATAVARLGERCQAPDFAERAFTYHGAHPLEVREALSDSAHDFGEAERLNAWVVKNRGDGFIGARAGVAPAERYAERVAELTALRDLLGFPQSAGITLHNEQQGASAAIDPNLATPVKAQIEAVVTKTLASQPAGTFRSFGIHFGKTEFTITPDQETVQWIDWAGEHALALQPGIRVEVNNHTTGSQPVQHYDDLGCPPGTNAAGKADYYDLAFHTDDRFGVKVHTVMFYPLEGPAYVDEQRTFAHKLCLMKEASEQGRPLTFFPEGSWWLSFDNPIPVYLPLYIGARHRDIELVRPLLPRVAVATPPQTVPFRGALVAKQE